MAVSAFKGQVFVIELLNVRPVCHREFDGFGESNLQINFHADASAGELILPRGLINIPAKGIADGLQ